MLSLKNIQRKSSVKLGILRSIDRLIRTPSFEEIFDNSSADAQEVATALINCSDRIGLDKWVKENRQDLPHVQPVKYLRQTAAKLGVRNYNHLTKSSLLSEIANASQRSNSQS